MKTLVTCWIVFSTVVVFSITGCGSSGGGSTSTTGTVTAKVGVDLDTDIGVIPNVTEYGNPTAQYTRMYKMQISTDATCSSDWVTIYDDSSDTSDCATSIDPENPPADFENIFESPTLGTNTSVPAGTYNCMMAYVCDQMIDVIGAGAMANCEGAYLNDIYGVDSGGEAGAQVIDKYFSSSGSEAGTPGTYGDQGSPFIMDAFTVSAGGTTTLTFTFNSENCARYDPDRTPSNCYVEAPTMIITIQ